MKSIVCVWAIPLLSWLVPVQMLAQLDTALTKAFYRAVLTEDPAHYQHVLQLAETRHELSPEHLMQVARCQLGLRAPTAALQLLKDLPTTGEGLFWQGVCHQKLGAFASAISCYEQALVSDLPSTWRTAANRELQNCQWAARAQTDSVAFTPINLGPGVNGPGEDYNAYEAKNGSWLVFQSHRAGNVGGGNERRFHTFGSDLFFSTRLDTGWSRAERALGINTEAHEKEAWWSPDGEWLLFGRHTLRDKSPRGIRASIYSSTWDQQLAAWTTPQLLDSVFAGPHITSWPSYCPTTRELFFISNRKGGTGGFDIWVSEQTDDGWSAPRPVKALNSHRNEFDVHIVPDGNTLYFSSNGRLGFGGHDIYRCTRQPDGSWSVPTNLGWPVNSAYDELDFALNHDGTAAYFNSDRFGGYGQSDIYTFQLDQRIQPAPDTLPDTLKERSGHWRTLVAVYFPTDSATLTPTATTVLGEVVPLLARQDSLRLVGYTDPRASDAYNQALAAKRCASVQAWLQTYRVSRPAFKLQVEGERSLPLLPEQRASDQPQQPDWMRRCVQVQVYRSGSGGTATTPRHSP